MGWNGSGASTLDASGQRKQIPARTYGKRHRVLFIVMPLAILLIVCLTMFWPGGSDVEDEGNGRTARALASSGSSSRTGVVLIATNKASKTSSVSVPEVEHAEVFMTQKIEGRLVVWVRRDPPPVFTNQFENYVASILTSIPGERFLTDTVNDEFDAAFKESLGHTIEINEDDSDDLVELKKAVIATKEEIRQQVAGGQKPSEIVVSALKEMNKIADYRDQVQKSFDSYLLTESDPQEIMKFKKEADALLDEYGALHINGPQNAEEAYERMVEAKEEKADELSEKLKEEK